MPPAGVVGRTVIPAFTGSLRELGNAEIEDLHTAVGRQEHVLRLDIAVDDATLVRGSQALSDCDAAVDRLARGNRAVLERLAQRHPFEQLGDDERRAVVLTEVVHGEDVRVIERGGGAGFLFEAREPFRIAGKCRRQHLDRHDALETIVAGAVDLAHAARAERTEDLGRAKARASG